MDEYALSLQLACNCLRVLSNWAIQFSKKKVRRMNSSRETLLCGLGARLFLVAGELEHPGSDSSVLSPTSLEKLLIMLDTMCTAESGKARRNDGFANLRTLADVGVVPHSLETSLQKAVADDTFIRSVSSNLETIYSVGSTTLSRAEVGADQYPAHVYTSLYTILEERKQCICSHGANSPDTVRKHRGSLVLGSREQTPGGDPVFETAYKVAKTHCHTNESEWRRFKFHVPKSEAKREKVRLADTSVLLKAYAPEMSSARYRAEDIGERIDVARFCMILLEELGPIYRRFKVAGGDLLMFESPDPAHGPMLQTHAVTLAEAMTDGRLSGHDSLRLAHVIAKSVWEYYESPWMHCRWTDNEIHFILAEGSGRKLHGPFIPIVFQASHPETTILDREYLKDGRGLLHRAPRIVALGVLLAKVLTGQTSTPRRDYPDERAILNAEVVAGMGINDNDLIALEHLQDGAKKSVSEAVKSCFDSDHFTSDNDVSERRDFLLKRVVAPLEEAVSGGSQKRASSLWKFETSLPVSDRLPATSWRTAVTKGSFYDKTLVNVDAETQRRADRFIKDQCRIYNDRIGGFSGQNVKIAVLDTGLDQRHPWFFQHERIKGVRDWVGPIDHNHTTLRDQNGHGTHIAGIVFRNVPDAHLYVGRIAEEEPMDPATIAEALDHAVEIWDVDIVIMSFGFDSEVGPGCSKLDHAIRKAYEKRVLIFAAASNEGANRPRAFPARHHAVFGIHSTDGKGSLSDYNTIKKDGDHNFGTLGEGIESTWPRNLNKDEGFMRKSGTSYATPIAASIAAFILLYARQHLDAEAAAELKAFNKMRGVLQATAVSNNGYEIVSLDTMFGPHRDARTIEGILREILAGTYRKG